MTTAIDKVSGEVETVQDEIVVSLQQTLLPYDSFFQQFQQFSDSDAKLLSSASFFLPDEANCVKSNVIAANYY